MLFGIQASQDVKLRNIARSLEEEIPLIKTEDRLSRNLQTKELEDHLCTRLVSMGSRQVEANTVFCLDLRDVRKEYAQKMECLDQVWDGSSGEVHQGYWLCSVTGAEVQGGELTPLYQKLFSARAKEFISENAEILAAIDQLRAHSRGRGIWAIDRGGDRKKLLEPLLERGARFVIRSVGQRLVVNRRHRRVTVHHLGACCRLRYPARVIKIEGGQEKIYTLRYGAEPIRLPGREEPLFLVVVAGFGQQPLLLLTNLEGVQGSQSLWWIVQIYLTRWKIEETFRFIGHNHWSRERRVLHIPTVFLNLREFGGEFGWTFVTFSNPPNQVRAGAGDFPGVQRAG